MKLNLILNKKEIVTNATQEPRVYFGMHFVDGVAYYAGDDKMIYVSADTAKAMDKTFTGKPVFVQHKSDWELSEIEEISDGYVIRSFFNPNDGKHWVEFIITSDEGHKAIKEGKRLSNGYEVVGKAGSGQFHGIDYVEEYTEAVYNHLALVDNPRYDEGFILTPEEFKNYNDNLKAQNKEQIHNSKETSMKFNLFSREKVQNENQLKDVMVELPKSRLTLSVENAIEKLDEELTKENTVDVDGEKLDLNSLHAKYNSVMKKNNELESEIKKYRSEETENESDEDEDDKDKEKKNKKNQQDKEKAENSKEFKKVMNAGSSEENTQTTIVINTVSDMVKKGKELY